MSAAATELSDLDSCRTLGVYDLGGGAFSFSVLTRPSAGTDHNEWSVAGASKVPLLGGELFDAAIVEDLVKGFESEHGINLSNDHLALQRLYEAAENAKLELATAHQADISLPFITADMSGPKHLEAALSRAKFNSLAEPLLQRGTPTCDEALSLASLSKGSLDAILMIGGSARLHVVSEHAASVFGSGLPLMKTARPEESVALGAAVVAARMQEEEFKSYG